eukprot:tig00000367_g24469.t1
MHAGHDSTASDRQAAGTGTKRKAAAETTPVKQEKELEETSKELEESPTSTRDDDEKPVKKQELAIEVHVIPPKIHEDATGQREHQVIQILAQFRQLQVG